MLDTLVRRVRVLTLEQVARTWFAHTVKPQRHADVRLGRLECAGLIHRHTVLSHPELCLKEPMATWSPGEASPVFSEIARLAARRWSAAPRSCKLVVASKSAGTWLGGRGGRWPRLSEVGHDITLSGVYLRFRSQRPEWARAWVSEDLLGRFGFKRDDRHPDAVIDAPGALTAIELAGVYRRQKLRDFHAFCEDQDLAYEIW